MLTHPPDLPWEDSRTQRTSHSRGNAHLLKSLDNLFGTLICPIYADAPSQLAALCCPFLTHASPIAAQSKTLYLSHIVLNKMKHLAGAGYHARLPFDDRVQCGFIKTRPSLPQQHHKNSPPYRQNSVRFAFFTEFDLPVRPKPRKARIRPSSSRSIPGPILAHPFWKPRKWVAREELPPPLAPATPSSNLSQPSHGSHAASVEALTIFLRKTRASSRRFPSWHRLCCPREEKSASR